MRTFEIPGCGGLMASQHSLEQERFFPDGEGAIYFRTPDEAVQKIAKVLAQPEQLESMQKHAHSLAQSHTYAHRAKALLDAVDSNSPISAS